MFDHDFIIKQYPALDRKSTRLNSSHVKTSYAVFCLEKKAYRRRTRLAHPGRRARRPWAPADGRRAGRPARGGEARRRGRPRHLLTDEGQPPAAVARG